MIALTSYALETYTRGLGTCVPNCADIPARLFFMLEVHGPQGAVRHVTVPEPTSTGRWGPEPYVTWHHQSSPQLGGEVQSHRTHGNIGAHLSREVRYRGIGNVVAPEPTSTGRWGSELRGMWQRRSPSQPKGEVRSHRTRGSARAHLSWEVKSGAAGHVTAPKPT
jgi:hypothetical protein